ncbi:MAG: Zn-dependent alcohol dehydrogenase [Hydrogenophaga sp.]|uniref:Zn-dependent alcohol dehydrogenase n=1 Tax=Hydrogenophaga sp. TaxID=1904254 RepID=UPI001D1BC655|nr:Zn-dependent alcohol dehydrogenase [Hydrogenophaga sp.]MBX3610591.1 Zn-dependent alcohol dehydrogenase [Hydrogenophaga sp.]
MSEKRKARAVLARAHGAPVTVEDVWVDPPRTGEVMLQMSACGVCHSDLSAAQGIIPLPPPVVLGHEGAGTVIAVGDGVHQLAVGDRVVTSFVSMCGHCRYCSTGRPQLCDQAVKATYTLPDGTTRLHDMAGNPLNIFSGCGVMADMATLHQDNVVKIEQAVSMECCALVSCGVMTGVGAVVNAARVQPGSTAVVFGAGGVGLNAIQGCHIAGAAMIVAVDRADSKLELARLFGATHTVNASHDDNLVKTLRKLTGGGADYAFECVGLGEVVAQAYGCLRKGGTAVAVGVASVKDTTTLKTLTLSLEEKTLTGCYYGSGRPREDFPRLIALYRAGRLKLDELITHRYRIDEAPQAFADLSAGRNARGMIVFD